MIKIYTDGASKLDPQKNRYGGWGYIIIFENGEVKRNSGSEFGATNQKMELTAAALALEEIGLNTEKEIELYSDSAYLINSKKDKWYVNWELNGWKNSNKKDVVNRELWERIVPFFKNSKFTFIKVAGHMDNAGNIEADRLASNAALEIKENR